MTAVDPSGPLVAESIISAGKTNWNLMHANLQTWKAPAKLLDDDSYNTTVLQLNPSTSEDDLDDRVALEAQSLGLLPHSVVSDLVAITSSLSTVTVASDSINQSSIQSQSTGQISCASSDHRPLTRSSQVSDRSPTHSESPSFQSEGDTRRNSPLRRGLRKMTGFRKKRSGSTALASPTLTSISSDTDTQRSEEASIDMKSPLSIKSSKSSWSQPLSVSKPSYEQPLPFDEDATKRSIECRRLLNLRMSQMDEMARFLEFQSSLILKLRAQKEDFKRQRQADHESILSEQSLKNEQAVEELEARQLEEEMKMQKEHELEKRAVMVRLRHMEAYCHNPTPPPEIISPASGRSSTDSSFPERRVTDKDYHNLAQQYRERDAMDTLHTSKINVLRGRQKKAVEKLMAKKEGELKKLELEQEKQLQAVDQAFGAQEADLRLALEAKRIRLETRSKTQALIERTKMEKATGLTYAPLPDVMAIEDPNATGLAL